MLLKQYLPAGVLGLGITALLASFMSGMAGNVSAFNTVWTYDIYQSYIRPRTGNEEADGKHYLKVGRIATIFGILLSIAAAYIASKFGNIMDFLQTIFSMINAPLFAVIFLGMFWKTDNRSCCIYRTCLQDSCWHFCIMDLQYLQVQQLLLKVAGLQLFIHILLKWLRTSGQQLLPLRVSTSVTVGLTFMTKQKKSDDELTGSGLFSYSTRT